MVQIEANKIAAAERTKALRYRDELGLRLVRGEANQGRYPMMQFACHMLRTPSFHPNPDLNLNLNLNPDAPARLRTLLGESSSACYIW